MLLEHIGESIDAVLDPLLSRALIKRGRFIKIGDKEVDYHPNFRLILQTKLANPHYKPEMQAQTTIINFTVTPDGYVYLWKTLVATTAHLMHLNFYMLKVLVYNNVFVYPSTHTFLWAFDGRPMHCRASPPLHIIQLRQSGGSTFSRGR